MNISTTSYNYCSLVKNIDIVRQLCMNKYNIIFLQETFITIDDLYKLNNIDDNYFAIRVPYFYKGRPGYSEQAVTFR